MIAAFPVLLLLAALLLGRYPGEERIERLRRARCLATSRPTRPATTVPAPRAARSTFARGGLLLARGLAVRPPPARPAHA